MHLLPLSLEPRALSSLNQYKGEETQPFAIDVLWPGLLLNPFSIYGPSPNLYFVGSGHILCQIIILSPSRCQVLQQHRGGPVVLDVVQTHHGRQSQS